VLLVDDHVLLRVAVALLFKATSDLTVVGEAEDGERAVALVHQLRPQVVLMDLAMPKVDGVEATRRIMAEVPGTRVLVLTGLAEFARVREALRAGARGYLFKDCQPAALVAAVRAAGQVDLPTGRPVAGQVPPAAAAASSPLSPRQRQILALVCRGLANREIGAQLAISERTVKLHLGEAFRRIGVCDRTSAALWARQHLGYGRQ
jgi:DNA-binding NarL/FixJ family response regulator